jgi:hypothetical protein
MDQKSINNFVINIKASFIINTFLYDYLNDNEMFNDIKEESNPDEIHVVGYTFKNGVIIVAVTYFDECLECGAMYEEFDIALEDFIEYLQND